MAQAEVTQLIVLGLCAVLVVLAVLAMLLRERGHTAAEIAHGATPAPAPQGEERDPYGLAGSCTPEEQKQIEAIVAKFGAPQSERDSRIVGQGATGRRWVFVGRVQTHKVPAYLGAPPKTAYTYLSWRLLAVVRGDGERVGKE